MSNRGFAGDFAAITSCFIGSRCISQAGLISLASVSLQRVTHIAPAGQTIGAPAGSTISVGAGARRQVAA